MSIDHSRFRRSLLAAAAYTLLAFTPAFAKNACVGTHQEFAAALAGFDGSEPLTIQVQQGLYPMSSTPLAGTPFNDGARPQDLDVDKDGKLDRAENPAFVIGGDASLAIECGYAPQCEARQVDPYNTSLFQFGDAERLAIRVQERARLSISGCGFVEGMLWIVHGGDGTLAPPDMISLYDPVTGYQQITLDRNAFYGSMEKTGSKLVIQEEAGHIVEPPNAYSDATAVFDNLSSPRITLTQNVVVGSKHPDYCAVEIGDLGGPEDGYDRLHEPFHIFGVDVGGDFSVYEDPWGHVDLVHNSVGGNEGCGLRLLTGDPVYMANNIFAGNGTSENDITVFPYVQLFAEFNLFNQLETWPPKWPGFAPLLLGNIPGDAQFRDPIRFDLRLQGDSPAIDAATPIAVGEPGQDIVGAPRIRGHWPDMGAYESAPE